MRLLKLVNAGQGVKVSGQPAIVLSEQARDELRRNVRGRAYEIFPALLRRRSSRHEYAPGSNADVRPIKVQDGGKRNYLLYGLRLPQGNLSLRIHSREGGVKAGQRRVVQERVEQIPILAVSSSRPIAIRQQCGHPGAGEWVGESPGVTQALLQLGKREAGVDGQKRSLWVVRLQGNVVLPTIGASAITQDFQQGPRFFAIRNTKDAVRPRERRQFSG